MEEKKHERERERELLLPKKKRDLLLWKKVALVQWVMVIL